jgi:hypothetical protein
LTYKKTDCSKSIGELENNFRAAYAFETGLVEKVHTYRKIPIQDLSVEQLRLLIGQNEGLDYLIPKAIQLLNTDILIEGDMYEGDLLCAVLSRDPSYWETHQENRSRICSLLADRKQEFEKRNKNNSLKQVIKKVEEFCTKNCSA